MNDRGIGFGGKREHMVPGPVGTFRTRLSSPRHVLILQQTCNHGDWASKLVVKISRLGSSFPGLQGHSTFQLLRVWFLVLI